MRDDLHDLHDLHVLSALGCLALATACAGSPAPDRPDGPGPTPPAAPWSAAALSPTRVPGVYLQRWARADNRETCALVAPAAVDPADATPRAATFAGGWAVAYDLPGRRSAFGVAGTGTSAAAPSYDDWPAHARWADGSSAGYGPEGGQGPKELAYLRIAGEGCLYNVWSHLGRGHLETLLASLRFVATP